MVRILIAKLEHEAKLLDAGKFVAFSNTGLGKRMQKADLEGRLYREQPFMLGLGADEVYGGQDREEMIMIQGIIHFLFSLNILHNHNSYILQAAANTP